MASAPTGVMNLLPESNIISVPIGLNREVLGNRLRRLLGDPKTPSNHKVLLFAYKISKVPRAFDRATLMYVWLGSVIAMYQSPRMSARLAKLGRKLCRNETKSYHPVL